MKLASMAYTKAEAEQQTACTGPMDAKDGPRYPWGLCLNLENGTLEKLDMSELPDVGATLLLTARVTVQAVSSSQTEGGEERRSVSLQITAMELEPEKVKKTAESSLYEK